MIGRRRSATDSPVAEGAVANPAIDDQARTITTSAVFHTLPVHARLTLAPGQMVELKDVQFISADGPIQLPDFLSWFILVNSGLIEVGNDLLVIGNGIPLRATFRMSELGKSVEGWRIVEATGEAPASVVVAGSVIK